MTIQEHQQNALSLLEKLIKTPSFSSEEDQTALLIEAELRKHHLEAKRVGHNVWTQSPDFDDSQPTILLNSHHDTVRPGKSWTKDPFKPTWEDDKLFGLGSNDAGGCLVSLLHSFLYLIGRSKAYNLIFLASAEEESTGPHGAPFALNHLPPVTFGIVGEPTSMNMAIAEKGLLVLDCEALGKSGHAARNEGENALYKAMDDIEFLRNYHFPRRSALLGDVHLCVTQIQAGTQHNVVPDCCTFVVDVRTNECYSNDEVLEFLDSKLISKVKARSTNLNSSFISPDHPIVNRGKELGLSTYGSATMSDQVHMKFPTLKIGPGDTHRSHTPDEYIYGYEIREGIQTYVKLLEGLII